MYQDQNNNYLSNPSLKDRARGVLASNPKLAIPAFFVVWITTMGANLVVSFLFSFVWTLVIIMREISASSSASILWELIGNPALLDTHQELFTLANHVVGVVVSFFTGILNVGLCLLVLNLACMRKTKISDVFYGFSHQFGKSLKLAIIYTLVQEIYLLPFNIYYYLTKIGATSTVLRIWLAIAIIALVFAIYLLLQISQCFFLLLDFPEYSAGKILRLSCRIMKGHKMRLFLLNLSFLPLALLSLFTFGLGFLWVIPYRGIARAFFFLNLMQVQSSD